eukprot:4236793-Pyramimonas_sp.AAC.1
MQLNSVLLATQETAARSAFPAVECADQLAARSDGSFKREEGARRGTRGALYMRLGMCRNVGKEVCHLLRAVGRLHKFAR